ncbi:MAG: hypothetical protein AAFV53_31790 [Myxococcota bacterium]
MQTSLSCRSLTAVLAAMSLPSSMGSGCMEEEVPGEEDWDLEDWETEDEPDDPPKDDPPKGDLPKDDPPKGDDRVPLSALEKERKARQRAEERARKLEEQEAERRRKAEEEKGEFKSLYEQEKAERAEEKAELEALRKEKADREAQLKTTNKERLDKLPDALKALVPEGLSSEAMAQQIGRLERMAGDEDQPSGTFRPGRKKKSDAKIPAEAHEDARKAGMKNGATQEWFENVWTKRVPRGRRWAKAQSAD